MRWQRLTGSAALFICAVHLLGRNGTLTVVTLSYNLLLLRFLLRSFYPHSSWSDVLIYHCNRCLAATHQPLSAVCSLSLRRHCPQFDTCWQWCVPRQTEGDVILAFACRVSSFFWGFRYSLVSRLPSWSISTSLLRKGVYSPLVCG